MQVFSMDRFASMFGFWWKICTGDFVAGCVGHRCVRVRCLRAAVVTFIESFDKFH